MSVKGFERKGDLVTVPQEVELAFLVGGHDAKNVLEWVLAELDPEQESMHPVVTTNFPSTIKLWLDRYEIALERFHEYGRLRAKPEGE